MNTLYSHSPNKGTVYPEIRESCARLRRLPACRAATWMIALWQLAVPSVEVLLLTKSRCRSAKIVRSANHRTAPSFLVLLLVRYLG